MKEAVIVGYHLWGYIWESSLHHFHSEWHLCNKRDHNSIWPPCGVYKWRWNRVAHLTNTQIQQDKQEKGNVMIAHRVHRLGKLSNISKIWCSSAKITGEKLSSILSLHFTVLVAVSPLNKNIIPELLHPLGTFLSGGHVDLY